MCFPCLGIPQLSTIPSLFMAYILLMIVGQAWNMLVVWIFFHSTTRSNWRMLVREALINQLCCLWLWKFYSSNIYSSPFLYWIEQFLWSWKLQIFFDLQKQRTNVCGLDLFGGLKCQLTGLSTLSSTLQLQTNGQTQWVTLNQYGRRWKCTIDYCQYILIKILSSIKVCGQCCNSFINKKI